MKYQTQSLRMADGSGSIECFEVLPGIRLLINKIRGYTVSELTEKYGSYCINSCIRGQFELLCSSHSMLVLRDGDMAISSSHGGNRSLTDQQLGKICFPSGCYDGVEIDIDPEKADAWFRVNMAGIPVSISKLMADFMHGQMLRKCQPSIELEHILHELYAARPETDLAHVRLKILELFLMMDKESIALNIDYLSDKGIDLARHIRDHLVNGTYSSLEDLAAEHGMSVSGMQKAFKAVYGTSIYYYLKKWRLETAAEALLQTDKSVTTIALEAGYRNPSKVSKMFKMNFGISPRDYRHKK